MPFDSVLPTGAATMPADPAPVRAGVFLVAQRVAASLLQAPHARLCLLDAAGALAGDDGAARCDGVDATLAAAVAARGTPLVVGDADAEADVAIARLLRALGWRAYLGVTVVAADGALLGVLAVADARARDWQPADVERLADAAVLAAEACTERTGDVGDAARWLRRIARREARAARRTSERRLALIFNSTADLTFLVSVDGGVLRCAAANDALLAAVGRDAAHVVGRPLDALLPAAAAAIVQARCAAALRGGEPLRYEQRLPLPAGSRTLDLTLTPILDDAPRCAYVLGVARDVPAVG